MIWKISRLVITSYSIHYTKLYDYSDHPAPREIIISEKIEDAPLISELLSEKSGYNVEIKNVSRGRKKELLEQVKENAKQAIERRVAEYIGNKKNLEEMAIFFGLSKAPERIEIYDNSHIQGAHAIGAMVVAGEDGFIKRAYRKFNIKNEAIFGDDFAMMREVIRRRFKGSNKNENRITSYNVCYTKLLRTRIERIRSSSSVAAR